MVVITLVLLSRVYQYAGSRNQYPVGLTIGGVDISGMTREQASEILTNRYIEAPVLITHKENSFDLPPSRAEFNLDLTTMLSEADFQRSQQDFWAGFWGYLWGRPIEVTPISLEATYNQEALTNFLVEVSSLTDAPAQPPQPVPRTLSFQYGTAGTKTNVEASFADIEAALYRPSNREATLVVEPKAAQRPNKNLLERLLINRLLVFEQETRGVASVFILDLQTGEEININGNVAMSGMDLLKVPIALTTYRQLDRIPSLQQRQWLSDTLVVEPDHASANALLNMIAGEEDPYRGLQLVTESIQRLGLVNTVMAAPYDGEPLPGSATPSTPANSVEGLRTNPNVYQQTTAEDMGILMSMLYYCDQGAGGALMAVYPNEITTGECHQILNFMQQNHIGSLIEEGVPQETAVAHRHGWISDTHGDTAIIYSPAGDYVLTVFLYKPDWLEWELSSPLIADISRATYNFFNFDEPYLGN